MFQVYWRSDMGGRELMWAMVLEETGKPLQLREIAKPLPGPDQVLIKVRACGVCRTDLHVVDGELPEPRLPLIPGHEIVGTVVGAGALAGEFRSGDRVGVPWMGYTCSQCEYCRQGQENLCDQPKFMGYTLNGGYAEYVVADYRYCFRVPESYSDTAAAPLLCAGLIGYRSYRMIGARARRIGIYGFGAAGHIIAQIAVYEQKRVYAFTRSGDKEAQQFALKLGASWAGESSELPPEPLDAAILLAPVGALLPAALRATAKGGIVVCGGIHMSDIPSFPYRLLWEERIVRSVANLTRADGEELLALAPKVPVRTQVELFRLDQANEALERLRKGTLQGAAVLTPL
jgi:propanol-preferring alcohol dehydrogenase